MEEFDEVQQLEIQKEYLQEQLNGINGAEMDFTEANQAMINSVKEKEEEDDLVSGTGSGWKEIVPTVTHHERVESGDPVVEEEGCCVIA